jgi:hypothetical protein
MIRKGRVREHEEGTRFVVVDLDVFSRKRLAALAGALEDRTFVLYEGRHGRRQSAHFELDGWKLTVDQEIQRLIALIKRLPRQVRDVWDDAQSREFNIGIQSGLEPRYREFKLSPRTIALVAEVRATIVITVYAPEASATRVKPPKKARRSLRSG